MKPIHAYWIGLGAIAFVIEPVRSWLGDPLGPLLVIAGVLVLGIAVRRLR